MSAAKYRDKETVDFAIVGSGAAGGVIARELARAGFSVVLFEQGPRLAPADFEHDELKYWFLGGITNDADKNPQTFRSDPSRKAELQRVRPPLWYGERSAAAACTTPRTTGASTRSTSSSAVALGAIPGTAFDDWPITYADLEPYYTKVEWEIGVSGLAGASPFDPPRTQAVSDAAAAGEVVGRAVRARRAQARAASVPGADGDQFAGLQRSSRMRALRVLSRLRVRGGG